MSPAGWLPRTGISSRILRSVIEYGLPFYRLTQVVLEKRLLNGCNVYLGSVRINTALGWLLCSGRRQVVRSVSSTRHRRRPTDVQLWWHLSESHSHQSSRSVAILCESLVLLTDMCYCGTFAALLIVVQEELWCNACTVDNLFYVGEWQEMQLTCRKFHCSSQ